MTPASVWEDARLAVALFAIDPAGLGGIALRARAGPVRDRLLAMVEPVRRLPAELSDEALFGGLDLAATLAAGKPIRTRGLVAELDGGTLVSPMAERMPARTAALLAGCMDGGAGFGLVALDEGAEDDEHPPSALLDRLAFHVDLTGISHRDAAAGVPCPTRAPGPAMQVSLDDRHLKSLCEAAAALGVDSPRAILFAARAARASALLAGRTQATDEDAALAARLVLSSRATRLPAETAGEAQPGEPPPSFEPSGNPLNPDQAGSPGTSPDGTEIVLAAARAAIPPGLLATLQAGQHRSRGRDAGVAGQRQKGARHGRPVGVRQGSPGRGLRLNLVETLRAAAPWQRLRAPHQAGPFPLHIRRQDFRLVTTEQRARSTTIFVVDASGSSALNRLAEAKGAVELLLAECYRRRDEVAVIAFRSRAAQLLLPPTRSLVRAKRSLATLPGGGGTPLAAGIDAGCALALAARRTGATPTLVLLTDGRANVTRAGTGGRAQAGQDALQSARHLRQTGIDAVLLDTSPRPAAEAGALACAMGARYVPLPYADAAGLSRAIRVTT